MSETSLRFFGLDQIEERLRNLRQDDAAYLVLVDRTDRQNEETLGRFDLTAPFARAYLGRDPSASDTPARLELEEEGAEEEEGFQSPWSRDARDTSLTWGEVVAAACVWLRDITTRNCTSTREHTFRVRCYRPKGAGAVEGGSFTARFTDGGKEATPTLVPPKPASIHTPEPAPEGMSAWHKDIAAGYSDAQRITLDTFRELTGIYGLNMSYFSRELDHTRTHVTKLVDALVDLRTSDLRRREEQLQHQEKRSTTPPGWIGPLIGEVGKALQANALANALVKGGPAPAANTNGTPAGGAAPGPGLAGLPTELAAALPVFLQNPKLVSFVSKPETLKFLQQEGAVEGLVELFDNLLAAPPEGEAPSPDHPPAEGSQAPGPQENAA